MLASKLLSTNTSLTSLTYWGTNISSNVIPSGDADRTDGFLGLIWETGFSATTPPDTISAGWTKVAGITRGGSGTWRSSIQYKILTKDELGKTVSVIPYTSGSSWRVSLFQTTELNKPIRSVTVGSVNNSGANDPPAQTITGSVMTNTTLLYLAMYYAYPSLPSPTFTGATPTIIGDAVHKLYFYISPLSEINKPNVTVDLGSNGYSHLSSFYLAIT